MKSYLSLIPISAKVHRRQNRMTLLCIVFAVFMVTAVFSMAEMGFRMEQARLVGKHGSFSIGDLLGSSMGQTLLSVAVVLFLLILIAGVLMISSSMNSSVAQRTQFFGMMRCIGMSKQQTIRFVRLEALNWCKTAIPIGLVLGVVTTWGLCAVLRFEQRAGRIDDGDFIQTYQLSGGAYVQLLRYMQSDVTIDGLVAGDWPGATNVQALDLKTVGGCAAQGVLMNVAPEDDEALRVALVLVSADHCALVYQAVYPQRLGTDQIDDAVQHMVDSMDVLGGASAQDVG